VFFFFLFCFCSTKHWKKFKDVFGRIYWKNVQLNVIQRVKPNSHSYLIEAAILGNIAFLHLYLSNNGNLNIIDQRGRNGNWIFIYLI
jgi:hypothetical protein